MKTDHILLDHGGGGKISHSLITETMLPIFDNAIISRLDDGAILICLCQAKYWSGQVVKSTVRWGDPGNIDSRGWAEQEYLENKSL